MRWLDKALHKIGLCRMDEVVCLTELVDGLMAAQVMLRQIAQTNAQCLDAYNARILMLEGAVWGAGCTPDANRFMEIARKAYEQKH